LSYTPDKALLYVLIMLATLTVPRAKRPDDEVNAHDHLNSGPKSSVLSGRFARGTVLQGIYSWTPR